MQFLPADSRSTVVFCST